MPAKTVVNIGRTEIDGRAFLDYAKRYVINFDQLASGGVYRIPVEAGKHVLGVRIRIAKAFTGGTGIQVGDGATVNSFMQTGNVTVTTLNAVADSRMLATTGTLNTNAMGGKYFASTGFVIITIAGTLTAGQLVVEILFDGYEDPTKNLIANQ
jgi:hypothetical protein